MTPRSPGFKIDYDQKYLIPALKKAATASNNTLKILGSLWSAPAWMKSNNSLYDGVLPAQNYATFAQYLSKYVQAYKAAGLDIWAITPTNEPLGVGGSRESMVWTAATMNTFIRDSLGPQFKKDGLQTQIYIFDHNKGIAGSDATKWAQAMFGDANTKLLIAGSAVHWYGSTFKVFEDGLDSLHAVDPTQGHLVRRGHRRRVHLQQQRGTGEDRAVVSERRLVLEEGRLSTGATSTTTRRSTRVTSRSIVTRATSSSG